MQFLICMFIVNTRKKNFQAKRLWKFEDEVVIPGARIEVSNRGSLLTIESISASQSGRYSCIAIANFGEDTIEYSVKVHPKRRAPVTCDVTSAVVISDIEPIDNTTVRVSWDSPHVNLSCYKSLVLAWWTNESDSAFRQVRLPLTASSGVIDSLDGDGVGYYVQVNLIGPLNVVIYGETRSFVASVVLDATAGEAGIPMTLLAIVIGVIVVLLILSFVLFVQRRRIVRFLASGDKKPYKNGAEFNDYRPHIEPLRSDFMQNLAPQWPEPEWPEPEAEEFLKPQQRVVRSGSKGSISLSSWSSLFNVPDVSGSSVNIQNPRVSFIGRYRRE